MTLCIWVFFLDTSLRRKTDLGKAVKAGRKEELEDICVDEGPGPGYSPKFLKSIISFLSSTEGSHRWILLWVTLQNISGFVDRYTLFRAQGLYFRQLGTSGS